MPSLSSLPDELLCHISLFVYPPCLLSLGLGNKRLLSCCEKQLRKHKQLSKEKHTLTDLNPMNVPFALRDIMGDPSIAWHTSDFEVWYLRQGWHHWKEWNLPILTFPRRILDSEGEETEEEVEEVVEEEKWPWPWDDSQPLRDYSHLDANFYPNSELLRHREVLTDVLRIDAKSVNIWMAKLQDGYDEPLKAVLFAQCPRLTKLTFMMYDTGKSLDAPRSHPLHLFCRSIRSLARSKVPHESWPVGFQSLKKIVVGEFTDHRERGETFSGPARTVAPLFLLPTLESLQLTLFSSGGGDEEASDHQDTADAEPGGNDEDGEQIEPAGYAAMSGHNASAETMAPLVCSDQSDMYVFEWGEKVSSVKELTLRMCEMGPETIKSFISACKGLREFRPGTNSQIGFEVDIFDALAKQTATLEVLELFSHPLDPFRALDRRLSRFEKLARLDIPVRHLIDHGSENGSMKSQEDIVCCWPGGSEAGKGRFQETVWLDLRRYLPHSLQTLRVKGELLAPLLNLEMLGLIQALIDLIIGDFDLERQHSQLNYICLAAVPVISKDYCNSAAADELEGLCERQAVQLHGLQRIGSIEVFSVCDVCRLKGDLGLAVPLP